jgi:hypothetical protein
MSVVEWCDEHSDRCYEKSPEYAGHTHADGFGGIAQLMRSQTLAEILLIKDVTSGEKHG